jgi:hypothetical protein
MGATLWFYEVAWQRDPKAVLHQLQIELFQSKYNFRKDLDAWRSETEKMLDAELKSGDRFGLSEIYRNGMKSYAAIIAQPLPTEPLEQLAILRDVLNAGEGLGSILDVTDIDQTGGHHVTRVLSPTEIQRFTGSERPTDADMKKAITALHSELDRGESFALPIHDHAGAPTHWFFIGNTVD